MKDASILNFRHFAGRSLVRDWLWLVAALVFAMVIVGGATRLTDSGLSITEWQPLLGAIPPLSHADWLDAFHKYQQIPEYRIVNKGMSLAEFQVIYWWEWAHRFLGRFIGVAFLVPLVLFWVTGLIEPRLKPRLIGLFVLGGLQGALGWYMVMSGLVERTDVSQYRLAAHLSLATAIFAALVWVGLGIGHRRRRPAQGDDWLAVAIIALVMLQIALGGFVAGLDAGMGYNTWPLIDGAFIPAGLGIMEPWWRNLFENALTVQFQHRMAGYLLAVAVAVNAWRCSGWRGQGGVAASARLLLLALLVQIGLGIWTLLAQVPIALGLLHQGGALVVLVAALVHLHRLIARKAPVPPPVHDAEAEAAKLRRTG